MKLAYWLVPFLGVTAFAAYYHHWNRQQDMFSCPTISRGPFAEYEGRNGRREAGADIAKGTLQLLTYGLRAERNREFEEILARDYGLHERTIAGCIVSDSLVKYANGYNAVVTQHLKAKFGADYMEVAARKAGALYTERHPPIEKPEAK